MSSDRLGIVQRMLDNPARVNAGIIGVVGVLGLSSTWGGVFPSALIGPFTDTQIQVLGTVFLASAGISAMLAGFGGVIVTYGLMSAGTRFKRLRHAGGQQLVRNWTSIITTGLVAALFAGASALALVFGHNDWAWALFAVSVLLNTHCSFRQVYLLRGLADVTRAQDSEDNVNRARPWP